MARYLSIEFGNLEDRTQFARTIPEDILPKIEKSTKPLAHVLAWGVNTDQAKWLEENALKFGGSVRNFPTVSIAIEFDKLTERMKFADSIPEGLRPRLVNPSEKSATLIVASLSPRQKNWFETKALQAYGNIRVLAPAY